MPEAAGLRCLKIPQRTLEVDFLLLIVQQVTLTSERLSSFAQAHLLRWVLGLPGPALWFQPVPRCLLSLLTPRSARPSALSSVSLCKPSSSASCSTGHGDSRQTQRGPQDAETRTSRLRGCETLLTAHGVAETATTPWASEPNDFQA